MFTIFPLKAININNKQRPSAPADKNARNRKLILAALLALILVSCASPYKTNGFGGGYSDTALAPDVYRISFRGNGYTSKARAQDFALLRAADLTLSHGYQYFGIINETEGGSTAVINTPGYAITNANGYAVGNMAFGNSYTTFVPGMSIPVFKPESGLMIRCFNERPAGGFALDATFIARSLREKYHMS